MSIHIVVHNHIAQAARRRSTARVKDEVKHDPKTGQFTGPGGSGSHVAESHPDLKEHHAHLENHGFSMTSKVSQAGKASQTYKKTTSGSTNLRGIMGPERHSISVQPNKSWVHRAAKENPDRPSGYDPDVEHGKGTEAGSLQRHLAAKFPLPKGAKVDGLLNHLK
jgi:hypothetical protein